MSETLREIETLRQSPMDGESRRLIVTAFWGGEDDRGCIQLTTDKDFVCLTQDDVNALLSALVLWNDPNITSHQAAKFLTDMDTVP